MTKQDNGNGRETRLNNMQRKALAESVREHYKVLIDEAQKRKESDEERAIEHARKRLGYHLLKKQIARLESEKQDLETKLSELGFDSNGNLRTTWDPNTNQYVPVSSDVRRLLEGPITQATKELERERDQKIRKLWLADSIKEARSIIDF